MLVLIASVLKPQLMQHATRYGNLNNMHRERERRERREREDEKDNHWKSSPPKKTKEAALANPQEHAKRERTRAGGERVSTYREPIYRRRNYP